MAQRGRFVLWPRLLGIVATAGISRAQTPCVYGVVLEGTIDPNTLPALGAACSFHSKVVSAPDPQSDPVGNANCVNNLPALTVDSPSIAPPIIQVDSWMTLLDFDLTSGLGHVSLPPNLTGSTRQGDIADTDNKTMLTIQQLPAGCSYTLTAPPTPFTSQGGTGTYAFTVSPACDQPTATPSTDSPDWLHPAVLGDANEAGFVDANTTMADRTGRIGFYDQPMSVAVPDRIKLLDWDYGSGLGDILLTPSNIGATRAGQIVFGTAAASLQQFAAGCTYQLSASLVYFASEGGGGTYSITQTSQCDITPDHVPTDSAWLHPTVPSTSGAGIFSVDANTTGLDRTGHLGLNDQIVAIDQNAGPCRPTIIAAGASFQVTQDGAAGTSPQTITFGPLSNQALGSTPPALSATSTSGLTVTFSSNSQSVCTVLGVNITLLTTGTCSISADQSGNGTYAAAPTVAQTFIVLAVQPVGAFLDQNGAPALTFNNSTNFPDAGGFLMGAPGIVQAPNGTVWFTGRDIGDRYWINSWNGTSFGGWILLDQGILDHSSIPQIAINSSGVVYVVGKDIGGRVWSDSYNPSNQTFSGWVDRFGIIVGQPSLTAGQDGLIYVAVRSVLSNSPVYIKQIPANNGPDTTSWLNGGGLIQTDPQITSQGGTVYLTAEAANNTVYLLTFAESNQTYGSWTFTKGILNDDTIAAEGGNVFIAGRDSAGRIYWYSVTGNSWYFAGGAGVTSTVLAGGK